LIIFLFYKFRIERYFRASKQNSKFYLYFGLRGGIDGILQGGILKIKMAGKKKAPLEMKYRERFSDDENINLKLG